MKKIVVIGEVIAEIMAESIGEGFREPMPLIGPFPSGAPAIYAAQAARLGYPSAVISTVGEDDFGQLALNRLAKDGVDISGISIDSDRPTGSAFVRYRHDGGRDFIFNIRHSACGLTPDASRAQSVLDGAGHLHIMGSSLSGPEIIALNLSAARAIKARGGTLSFDPNLRKEILSAPGMREAMLDILDLADLFLPSDGELHLLTGTRDPHAAVSELFDRGISTIVHKLGAAGVRYHDREGTVHMPAFKVEEIDPTGAGDCFGAAFTVMWLEGMPTTKALALACAAGAIAVTRRGPMDGAAGLSELHDFVATQKRAAI